MHGKRVIAILLVVTLMAPFVPVYTAAQTQQTLLYSPDAFRMSDEYVEVFPNGLIEFGTVQFDTFKDSDDFDVLLVRRGGTSGEVSVSLKVVETTAKYGKDFVLIDEYGKIVEKSDDTPTMLESTIQDFSDVPLISSELETEEPVDIPKIEGYEDDAVEASDDDAIEASDDDTIEAFDEDTNEEQVEQTADADTQYASSLHKMKDEITGTQTEANLVAATSSFNLFGAEIEQQIEEAAYLNAIYPGTSLTFDFEDGENYKLFKVRIFDNDIIESDKHFTMGLYGVTGGAVLGEQLNAGCVINGDPVSNEDVTLSFSEAEYSISETADKLTVKVERTGNEQTYYAFDFKTLSGTAQAILHYTPLVETAVMLPGQTYKLVEIPITASGLQEPLSFELIALGDGGNVARAKVTINPSEMRETVSLLRAAAPVAAAAYTTPAPIVYLHDTFKYRDGDGDSQCDDRYVNGLQVRNVFLSSGSTRSAFLDLTDLDLRGIESVRVTGGSYNCSSRYEDRHTTAGWFTGYEGKGGWGHGNISPMRIFIYKPGDDTYNMPFDHAAATFTVYAGSAVYNYQDSHVSSLVLNKKEFKIQAEAADMLTAYIYDGQNIVDSKKFQPGYSLTFINKNIGRPNNYFRDDTVIIQAKLSADGIKYGAKLVGYKLKNNKTGDYSPLIPGTTLTLTPELISQYIYAGEYRDTLYVKPVYERERVTQSLRIPYYSVDRGTVKIGNEQINTWLPSSTVGEYMERLYDLNPKMMYGDSIRVYLLPNFGFDAKGLESADNIGNDSVGNSMVDFAVNKNSLRIVPLFSASQLTAQIIPDTNHLSTSDKGQIASDKKIDKLSSGEGYHIKNLSLDEMVTLYSRPDEGYITRWWYDDGTTDKLENDPQYAVHYGNSFSFPAKSINTVGYSFIKTTDMDNYILKGKVIQNKGTLKNPQSDDDIDPKDASTFKTVSDVIVAVAAASQDEMQAVINGKQYQTSMITSQTGEFAIYVPNIQLRSYFKVNCIQEDVRRNFSVIAHPGDTVNSYIVLPSVDPDYRVKKIYTEDEKGANGAELTIPNDYNNANTIFNIETKSKRTINEVRLRSYTADGYLIGSRVAERMGGTVSNEQWAVSVNMQELLSPGGRITVEIIDDRNVAHGEVEAGYTILKAPPSKMRVMLPAADAGDNGREMPEQPVVGGGNPKLTDSEFDAYEKDIATNGNYLDLALGVGEIYHKAIMANAALFDDLSPKEKGAFISSYITNIHKSDSTGGMHYDTKSQMDIQVGNNIKKQTTIGKLGFEFSYGFYLRLERNADKSGYNFRYLFLYAGVDARLKLEVNTFMVCVPAYASFDLRVQVKGVLGMVNQRTNFSEHNISKEFVLLLTKYGANRDTSASDTKKLNQDIYKFLYDKAGMNPSFLPGSIGKNKVTASDVTTAHLNYVAERLNTLLPRQYFYHDNQDVINKWLDNDDTKNKFSANLKVLMGNYGDGNNSLGTTTIEQFNFLLIKSLANPVGTDKYIQTYDRMYYSDTSLLNFGNLNWTGYIYYGIDAKIGAGIGHTSVCGVGLSGNFIFDIVYQPPSDGRGTFTFGLNIDINILGVNIPIRFLEHTWKLFQTENYVMMDGLDKTEGTSGPIIDLLTSLSIDARVLDSQIAKAGVLSVEDETGRIAENIKFKSKEEMMGGIFVAPVGVYGSDFAEGADEGLEELFMDTIKNPTPQLFSLEDGKRILIYLNDDLDRAVFDGSCAYYMIYDGENWGNPTAINDDGTYDGGLTAKKLPDGRIVVCFTSLSETVGNVSATETNAAVMLGSQTLQAVIFSADGIPGDVTEIAPAGYACSMPSIAYDEDSGRIVLTYKMTDYNTEGINFEMSEFENATLENDVGLQNYLSNSYSTLGYTLYDGAGWTDYDIINPADAPYLAFEAANGVSLDGMRFVSGIELPDYENPYITEVASAVYNGAVYIAYIADLDKDANTTADRDVFLTVFDPDSGNFIGPVRVTDDMVENVNINLDYKPGLFALYTGSGDSVVSYSLPEITPAGDNSAVLKEIQASGSVYYTIVNQSSPTYILENRSHEAAVSYTLIDGDDGNTYMLWSEFGTYTDDEDVTKSVQNLYMSMYDAKFTSKMTLLEEGGTEELVYFGAWGNPGALTNETEFLLSQPAMIVSEDGTDAVVVYKSTNIERVEKETGGDNKEIYEKEADISRMWLQEFIKVSSISHDEESVVISPAYPREGDYVTVRYSMKNYGTMPSEKIKLEYALINNGESVSIDGGKEMEQHFSTLLPIHDQVSFIMPACEEDLILEIQAVEDDLEIGSAMRINIPISANIELIDFAAATNPDDSITVVGKIINNGNASVNDACIEVVPAGCADEWTVMFGEGIIERPQSRKFDISNLAPGATYDFSYTIAKDENIDAYYDDYNTASFSLRTYFGDEAYTIAAASTKRNAPSLPTLTDVKSEIETASIKRGEELPFVITLSPYDASAGYSIEYVSSDPAIASVDPLLGTIKGLKAGQAVITANVYKDSMDGIMLLRFERPITDEYGNLITVSEDNTDQNYAERELAASCDLTVTVRADSTPAPTPGQTSDPETSPKPNTTETTVIIDGKEVDAGTIEIQDDMTIVTVNQDALQKLLENATNNLTIIVPAETGTAVARLVAHNLDDMADKDMTLTIQAGNVQYELPATAIDTAAILDTLGAGNANDVLLSFSIAANMSEAVQEAVRDALADGTELVFPPMEFKITAAYNGQTREIDTFNRFVTRRVEITAEQAEKITTAIVVSPDGTTRHVPTRVYQQDDKWYAEVRSLTNSIYAFVSNAKTFKDATGKWYESAVGEMGSRMIINGVSNDLFAGERDITRAEFAAVVIRALGLPATGNGVVFNDVPESAWYCGTVGAAYEYGLIYGIGNNQFAPDKKITRQESMIIIQRAAKLAGFNGSTGSIDDFTDNGDVSDWALDAVEWNVGSGLIVGSNGLLNPINNITRAESATFVLRFLQKLDLVDIRTKV